MGVRPTIGEFEAAARDDYAVGGGFRSEYSPT